MASEAERRSLLFDWLSAFLSGVEENSGWLFKFLAYIEQATKPRQRSISSWNSRKVQATYEQNQPRMTSVSPVSHPSATAATTMHVVTEASDGKKSTRCHHKKGKRIRGKRRRRRRFVDERFDALGLPVWWGTSERGIGRLQKEHYRRRRERRCRKGVSKRSNSSPKFITALLAELKASLSLSGAVDLPSDDGGRGPPLFRMFVKLLHFPGKVRSPPVPIEGKGARFAVESRRRRGFTTMMMCLLLIYIFQAAGGRGAEWVERGDLSQNQVAKSANAMRKAGSRACIVHTSLSKLKWSTTGKYFR